MSGNDLHVRRHLHNHLLHAVDHPINAAARIHVDKREAISHKVVAHVHDIRLGKEDDRVTVRMPCRKIKRADILPVQMHRHIVMIGSASLGAGFASKWTDPPFPAVPPDSSRLRTLSCAMIGACF